jgi:hypothetical protein
MNVLRYTLFLLIPFGLLACDGVTDLDVENKANPNRSQALSEPGDLESVAAGTFQNFYDATDGLGNPMAMSVAADVHTASWGNFSMRDHGREPRIEFNNSPSYTYAVRTETAYFDNYTGISNAIDVLASIGDGENQISPSAFDQPGAAARARAFASFNMGLSYLYLGAMFDRAALIDETDEFNGEELVPWSRVTQFGVQKMDQAIEIANNNEFTIPATDQWFFNVEMTSEELARLANSMKAKYVAHAARTPSQRSNLNFPGGVEYSWQQVYDWIKNGMEASGYSGAFGSVGYPGDPEGFIPVSSTGNAKFHFFGTYGNSDPGSDTWARSDYKSIGPADESNCEGYRDLEEPVAGIQQRPTCYDEWKQTFENDGPGQVLTYVTETDDKRIAGAEDLTCAEYVEEYTSVSESDCTVDGTDYSDQVVVSHGKYHDARVAIGPNADDPSNATGVEAKPLDGPFRTGRGTWHFSDRGFTRFRGYLRSDFGGSEAGPLPHTTKAQMDLLKAEALLHGASGSDQVHSLINNSRVENGELPPAEADDPEGSMSDPQNPIKSEGATLWSMLKHEWVMETWGTSTGVNFFTKRGWGDLREGTQLHYPIPGSELETLGQDIYTFGGVGGRCAVGNPSNCIGGSGSGSSGGGSNSMVAGEDHWSTFPSVDLGPSAQVQ